MMHQKSSLLSYYSPTRFNRLTLLCRNCYLYYVESADYGIKQKDSYHFEIGSDKLSFVHLWGPVAITVTTKGKT